MENAQQAQFLKHSSAQRGGNISALVYQHYKRGPGHDGQRHGKCTSNGTRVRCICGPTQCSTTPIVTLASCLETKRTRKRERPQAKPVSFAVLLLQDVAPKNAGCRGPHTTGPQMTLRTFPSEIIKTPASSAALLLQDKAPMNAGERGSQDWATNDPNQFFRRDNRNSPTGHFL